MTVLDQPFVMTEFPRPTTVLYFGATGRPSPVVHFTDGNDSTLCGNHGILSSIDLPVPDDMMCQRCSLAAESTSRYHRLT